jgi:hypothetical protein
MNLHQQELKRLAAWDFSGKGEAFVESKFLTPLLQRLGYETHKDYEVIRHGDDGSAFKLHHPPVEKGAVRVKHYSPDYILLSQPLRPGSILPFEPAFLAGERNAKRSNSCERVTDARPKPSRGQKPRAKRENARAGLPDSQLRV